MHVGIHQHGEARKDGSHMEITKEYLVLFNAITDIERELESLRTKLIAAQQLAEDLYISGDT